MLAHAWHDEPHRLTDRQILTVIVVCALLCAALAVAYCVMR